jgi:hypothetical protein
MVAAEPDETIIATAFSPFLRLCGFPRVLEIQHQVLIISRNHKVPAQQPSIVQWLSWQHPTSHAPFIQGTHFRWVEYSSSLAQWLTLRSPDQLSFCETRILGLSVAVAGAVIEHSRSSREDCSRHQ